MLVDGIAKQTCVQKNWKKKKKDCYQKVCLYATCHVTQKINKSTTLLVIIIPYHFKNRAKLNNKIILKILHDFCPLLVQVRQEQWFSNFRCQNHLEVLLKQDCWPLSWSFLFSSTRVGPKTVFLASSQKMLVLLMWGTAFWEPLD